MNIKAVVLDEYAKVTLKDYRKLMDRIIKQSGIPKKLLLFTSEPKSS